jgi:prevent-host-death family protein
MEKVIGLKELRANTEKYINATKHGNSFIVVRRSRPVFKISPIEDEKGWEAVADFTKIQKGGIPISDLLKRL